MGRVVIVMRCSGAQVHKRSKYAQKVIGLKAKLFQKKRYAEKATMKKTIAMHNERENKHKAVDGNLGSAMPAYLLDRDQVPCPAMQLLRFHHTIPGATMRPYHAVQALVQDSAVLTHPVAWPIPTGGESKGAQQHHKAETEGEGWEVGGATAQGGTPPLLSAALPMLWTAFAKLRSMNLVITS